MKYVPNIIKIPVMHPEVKFLILNDEILENIEKNNMIVFKYYDKDGNDVNYP